MYVKKIINNFKKEYGPDKWLERFFMWKNANKSQSAKALVTASKKGEKIVKSLAKIKKGKAKAKKRG